MRFVLGLLVVIPAVVLVVAAVRGRAQVRSCCAADPAGDRRMAAAFSETETEPAADAAPTSR